MIYLSLIIPCFNESKIIDNTLKQVIGFLRKKKFRWEVIIVDDGSTDNTSTITGKFKRQGVKTFIIDKNQGKGAALRFGVNKATGKFIVFTDADLSISIDHLNKMLEKLEDGYSVVLGSRRIADSKIVVHQPFIREKMGQVFTLMSQIISRTKFKDYTCGFKGFIHKSAKSIFEKSLINRWAYDTEIVFLAHKLGYKVGQVPVSWINREDSRVRLGSATLTSFLDLLKIRANNITGKYEK